MQSPATFDSRDKNPARDCPSHKDCRSICPLRPDYPPDRAAAKGRRIRCRLSMDERFKIAKKYPGILLLCGLTQREYCAQLKQTPSDGTEVSLWGNKYLCAVFDFKQGGRK